MLGFMVFFSGVAGIGLFLGFWWCCVFFSLVFFCFFFLFFSYGWEEYYGFFFLDSTSCLMISLSFLITYLMYLASVRVYNTDSSSIYLSFFFILLCLALVFAFSVSNFFVFFVFFEISLIPTLLIILGWGYQPERLQAGYYMMLYTIFSSLPLLAVVLFWGSTVWSYSIFSHWDFFSLSLSSFLGCFVFFFSFFSFFVKLPVYGVHLWLPKAHVEAPVSGSMILAGVLLKLGGYGLYRVFCLYSFCFYYEYWFLLVLLIWGGVLSSMACLSQSDLKGLVAYSSVGHMAILLCGYLSGSTLGSFGALLMMVGHGLCSSCMFVLASLSYDLFGSRSLFFVKGVLCVCPSVSMWWFVFSVGNMAAPTSLNLCSELMLFMVLLMKSYVFFFFVGLLSFLVGVYSLYFFLSPNHGFLLEGVSWFFSGSVLSFFLYFIHFFYLYFGFFMISLFIL